MYGDAAGNVAWFATAKLYKMPDSVGTKFVLNGADGQEDPISFCLLMVSAINPDWNYVYSANNQPDSTAGMFVPGYFAPILNIARVEL